MKKVLYRLDYHIQQGHGIGGGFVFGLYADFSILGREQLPGTIEKEIKMHDITFHQPEVEERIEKLFGR